MSLDFSSFNQGDSRQLCPIVDPSRPHWRYIVVLNVFSKTYVSSRHVLGPTFLLRHALADRGGLRQGLWADRHCLHICLACWPWRHDGLWNVTIINANHFLFIFFSSAMRRAWHAIHPDHNIRGCLFHFAQVRLFPMFTFTKKSFRICGNGSVPVDFQKTTMTGPLVELNSEVVHAFLKCFCCVLPCAI